MLKILEMIGFSCFLLVAFACIVVIMGIVIDVIKTFFRKKPSREVSERERLEMENTEYDWGHNIRNHMED